MATSPPARVDAPDTPAAWRTGRGRRAPRRTGRRPGRLGMGREVQMGADEPDDHSLDLDIAARQVAPVEGELPGARRVVVHQLAEQPKRALEVRLVLPPLRQGLGGSRSA